MARRYKEGLLPFKIVVADEPLIARSGLVLPYEMAKALKLTKAIDKELPRPGSGRGYKPSQFVMPLIRMFHGGGKKLEELREIKAEMSLREFLEIESLPASCTIGDWLRRMGSDGEGLAGLGRVNHHVVSEVMRRDKRNGYTLDVDASVIERRRKELKLPIKAKKAISPRWAFSLRLGCCWKTSLEKAMFPQEPGR